MAFTKILAVCLIVVAVVAVAIYLMGQFEPTKPTYNTITSTLSSVKDKAMSFLSSPNGILTSIGGIAGVTTIASMLYSKFTAAKTQLTSATDKLSSEANKIKSLESQITTSTQTAETKIAEYEAQIKKLQEVPPTDVTQYTTQIQQLEAQIAEVRATNSDFVKGLMQAANGALITNGVDGKIYSVLKLPPEKQIL